MPPVLRIHLFGGLQVFYDDAPVKGFGAGRLQALLACLLLHRHAPLTRQQLAFLFWPESSDAQAQTNLRQLLHTLRTRLPDADRFLEIDEKTVHWRAEAPYQLDVVAFEAALLRGRRGGEAEQIAALAEAVAAYSGDLLPNCYDDWILPERERLAQEFLSALERLVLLHEDRREINAAISYAQRLLRYDPLHEATYRRLMRLHALHGDRGAALRVYHACASVLQRELGVGPSGVTQEAYERLLHLDSTAVRPARETASVLVGRQAEWQTLQKIWRRVNAGSPHIVCVAGEAGIGKTRLAEEMLLWAQQQGILAVSARAYAAEGRLAYGAIAQCLAAEELQGTIAQLDDGWRVELARLRPEILAAHPHLPRPEPLVDQAQRQRLFGALARVFIAGRPLILVLDDLQWLGAESLEWLHYLLRFDPHARLLVIGTMRLEEVDSGTPLTALLLALRSADQLTELQLHPLDAGETAELAQHVAERPLSGEVLVRLHRMSEGNPFFVTELAHVLLAESGENGAAAPMALPPKVQAVIRQRLASLSPSARQLTDLAAVIGRSFTLAVLRQAFRADEDTLVRSLDELWQRRIVREQGAYGYDFGHDLVRETAYASISPARRYLLHRHVAEALEQTVSSEYASSAQIAWHYEQAGLHEPAVGYYSKAAAAAHQMYAFEDAIDYLNRALTLLATLPPNAQRTEQEMDLLTSLGAAWSVVKTCAAPETKAAYDRAFALSRQLDVSPQLFTALWGLHEFYLLRSEYDGALQASEECLRIAQTLQDPALLLEAHHAMWGTLAYSNRYHEAIQHTEQGLLLYSIEQHHTLSLHYGGHDPGHCGLGIASMCLWLAGYPEQARRQMQRAVALAEQFAVPCALADAAHSHAIMHQMLGETSTALRWAEIAMQRSIAHHYLIGEAVGATVAGWARTVLGEHSAGLALLRKGLAQWQRESISHMGGYLSSLYIEACCTAGEIDEGLAKAVEVYALIAEYGEHYYEPDVCRLHGALLEAQGRCHEAELYYRQAVDLAGRQAAKSLELRSALGLARLLCAQGRHREAADQLAPVYEWFQEGFDTPDLRLAGGLLAELRAGE